MGLHIPYAWSHSPFESLRDASGAVLEHGIMNVPALFIVFVLSLLLVRGTRESAFVNGLIVITKVSIVALFIVIGWGFMNPANHVPYIPPTGSYVDGQGVAHNFGGLMGI